MSGRGPTLTVRSLLGENTDLRLVLLAGDEGMDRRISLHRVQKPGLALAGYVRQVTPEQVQVLGATELSYLASLPTAEARHGVATFMALDPACIIVTKGLDVPQDLLDSATAAHIPLLRTPLASP